MNNYTLKQIEKVHVVFKTHLDIGFTDLSSMVTQKYMNRYIPEAIKLGYELKNLFGIDFKWTTGSWLIYEYLRTSNDEDVSNMINAINDGIINWHGLPFSTHTELMDRALFEFGISLSQKLDKRFGRKTIAAKMTDVPGHTKAIIPSLEKAGIQFLHIGVNPASAVPEVPDFFRWIGADNSEIIVNYSCDYGKDSIFPAMNEALYFAHAGDNCGPPSKEKVIEEYKQLRDKYPNAEIVASTLDDFAEALLEYKEQMPKVYEEIGDTWIHGVASDPLKVSKFRTLNRLRNKWINEGSFLGYENQLEEFSLNLLMIPEHTWGADTKIHLADYTHYSKVAFKEARKEDVVKDGAELKFREITNTRTYSGIEKSWEEQREYLNKAIECLPDSLKQEANTGYEELDPVMIKNDSYDENKKININETYQFLNFKVIFDENGAISYLNHDGYGDIFKGSKSCGLFTYEEIGKESYDYWFSNYVRDLTKNYSWSYEDFGKPGMEIERTETREHRAYVDNGFYYEDSDFIAVLINISGSKYASKELGYPHKVQIIYKFYMDKIEIELVWNNKEPLRLPESIWFSMNPIVNNENMWFIEKMGEFVSPLNIVKNGNRNIHAIDRFVVYLGAEKKIKIISKDAVLVAIGERKILKFDNKTDPSQGVHFNLYNNIWGTNFKMWNEDDLKFRFTIEFSK